MTLRRLELWSLDGRGGLEFSDPRLEARGSWFTCDATLTVEGEVSTVTLEMITPHRRMWAREFQEFADARPWRGRRAWSAEHAEPELAFTCEPPDVALTEILMRWPPTYDDERQATLRFALTDLARLASDLPAFLRLA